MFTLHHKLRSLKHMKEKMFDSPLNFYTTINCWLLDKLCCIPNVLLQIKDKSPQAFCNGWSSHETLVTAQRIDVRTDVTKPRGIEPSTTSDPGPALPPPSGARAHTVTRAPHTHSPHSPVIHVHSVFIYLLFHQRLCHFVDETLPNIDNVTKAFHSLNICLSYKLRVPA